MIIKFGMEVNLINIEARNVLDTKSITTLIVKCTNGYNYCRARDALIDSNLINSKYPRCSSPNTWDYVVKYSNAKGMRK